MLSSFSARSAPPFRSPKSSNIFAFQPLAASCVPPKKSTPLESSKYSLFLENTRVGGAPSLLFFRISNFQPLFFRPVATVATGFSNVASPSFSVTSVPPQQPILFALCFHTLTKPFSRKPFIFTSMQNPRGCGVQRSQNGLAAAPLSRLAFGIFYFAIFAMNTE